MLRSGGRTVGAAEQRILDFLGDPYRTDKEIDQTLEERGLIPFNAVACEKQNPPSDEERQPRAPESQNQENDSREDDRNSDPVQDLVPRVGVFVVVLSHVTVE